MYCKKILGHKLNVKWLCIPFAIVTFCTASLYTALNIIQIHSQDITRICLGYLHNQNCYKYDGYCNANQNKYHASYHDANRDKELWSYIIPCHLHKTKLPSTNKMCIITFQLLPQSIKTYKHLIRNQSYTLKTR